MPRRNSVWLPSYALSDIFSEEEMNDLAKLARDRVLNAFYWATELYRGKRRGTDNYIGGVGPRHRHLTQYVIRANMKPFMAVAALPVLPSHLFGLSDKQYEVLVEQIQEQFVQLAVNALCDEHLIWYDDHGLWNVCQSALDAWRSQDRHIRRAVKFDRRNYHGKVREQSKRRVIPAGAANSIM